MESRIVLGIDPGNARCGWGVVEQKGGHLSLIDCGCITTAATTEASERLLCVYNDISYIIDNYQPQELSIEKLFYNRNVTSAIAVAESRGVCLLAAAQRHLPVYNYTPSEIKEVMTGNGKASKDEVCMMVMMTLGLSKNPYPDDTADAVAIALTRMFWGNLTPS